MFTGIVEDLGKLKSIVFRGGVTMEVSTSLSLKEGESISVNGVCLTVKKFSNGSFFCDISPETYKRTTFKYLKNGDLLNLERALRISDRFGGHIVTGHVDGVGKIVEKRLVAKNFFEIGVAVPKEVIRYMVEKGSISLDGISLTIKELINRVVKISVIPYTFDHTNLKTKKIGDYVNVEADILAKYVEKLCKDRDHSQISYNVEF